MKVLVIGSGGREHAIAYKLNQSSKVDKIYAIPGNPGIAKIGECIDGKVEDNEMIVNFAKEHQIDILVGRYGRASADQNQSDERIK